MEAANNVFSNEFSRIIAVVQEINQQAEHDFFGEDGLLYCGACNVKKQHRLTIGGREYLLPSSCACRMAEWHTQEAERKAAKREANRENWIKDAELRAWRFAMDDGSNPEIMEAGRKYVENFEVMSADNIGLMICGNVGNGKTFVAACIANALIDRDIIVELTNISAIESRAEFKDDNLHRIVTAPDLLILDDFGAERETSTMENVTFRVIDYRVKSGKPLIVTTNVPLRQIKDTQVMTEKRVYDRLLEVCHPIENTGPSRRRAKAAKRYDAVSELLGIKKDAPK
jgi:DNA replication protein DnaC